MPDERTHPCPACPWLTANQGKPHPDGWYTKKNLTRLWSGMRRGEAMSCHPTDPSNPVSEQAQAKGYQSAPETAATKQCIGAAIATQREYMVLQEIYKGDVKTYRQDRPRGLTRDGIRATVAEFLFGGTIISGGRAKLTPDLNSPVTVPGNDWPLG